MASLHLSPDLKVPPEVVTETIGILGRKGSGKTTTASVLVEELLGAKLPVVIIDPTGAWWGLRSSKDGKSEGFPVTILGGDHGDAPLEETAGKVIAELVAEAAPPLVLDLSALSKSAARRFVADFCERLYEKNRTALHLVIDEADEFAPQNFRGDMARTFGAVDTLVRRGRIRGIGITMVTQRSAAINKDVLSQCEVLIAHRTSHPKDLEPILEWMKVHADKEQLEEVHSTIAHLANGEAWVMSPEWLDVFKRVQMRDRDTFNSSATPKAGERRIVPKHLAAVDLKLLQERMAETLERAKASDPNLLRRKVAELQAELAKAQKAVPAPAKGKAPDPKLGALVRRLQKAVEQAMNFIITINAEGFFKAGGEAVDRAQIQKAIDAAVANVTKMLEAKVEYRNHQIERLQKDAARILATLKALTSDDVSVEVAVRHNEPFTVSSPPRPSRPVTKPTPRATTADGPLPKGERAILTAAAQHAGGVTREQLTVLTGYKRSSRDTYLQRLRERGFTVDDGTRIGATAEGLGALGPNFEPLPTGAQLLDHWRNKLPIGEKAVLEVVVASWPEPVDRDRISELTQYQRSSRDTYLQRLRSRQLVIETGRGQVRASDQLFEGGPG